MRQLRKDDRVRLRVELFDPKSTVEQLGTVVGDPEIHLESGAAPHVPVVWDFDDDRSFDTWHPLDHLELLTSTTNEREN